MVLDNSSINLINVTISLSVIKVQYCKYERYQDKSNYIMKIIHVDEQWNHVCKTLRE